MGKLKVLFIPGHGGINPNTGKYVTPGKRSPVWKDGRQLFEGEFNREVVSLLIDKCESVGIKTENIVPEWQDISLGERVRRVNRKYQEDPNTLMIEIHANAAVSRRANGFEFFTATGLTASDFIADVMIEQYQEEIPEIRLRRGDSLLSKEKDFYVIRNTELKCPSILIECGFMTNELECKMMLDSPERFSEAIFKGLETVKSKFG